MEEKEDYTCWVCTHKDKCDTCWHYKEISKDK